MAGTQKICYHPRKIPTWHWQGRKRSETFPGLVPQGKDLLTPREEGQTPNQTWEAQRTPCRINAKIHTWEYCIQTQ
jgi:hypothetical protein